MRWRCNMELAEFMKDFAGKILGCQDEPQFHNPATDLVIWNMEFDAGSSVLTKINYAESLVNPANNTLRILQECNEDNAQDFLDTYPYRKVAWGGHYGNGTFSDKNWLFNHLKQLPCPNTILNRHAVAVVPKFNDTMFINVHMTTQDAVKACMLLALEVFVGELGDYPNLVIAGDFNISHNDPRLISFANNLGLTIQTGGLVGHVLYRGVTLSNFTVHNTSNSLSDHDAITCTVTQVA